MNTGIQDAHALAWRIATWRAVDAASSTMRLGEEPGDSERARLGEDPDVVLARLMRSYERERRPVAVGNTRLSVANFDRVLEVPAALGLPPAAANVLVATVPSWLPFNSDVVRAGLAVGRAQCGSLLVGDNPVGNARRAAVAEMCDRSKGGAGAEGGTLRLQFPAEDLGFGYDGAKGPRTTPRWTKDAGVAGAAAPTHPPNALVVGARVPHAWLTVLESRDGGRSSGKTRTSSASCRRLTRASRECGTVPTATGASLERDAGRARTTWTIRRSDPWCSRSSPGIGTAGPARSRSASRCDVAPAGVAVRVCVVSSSDVSSDVSSDDPPAHDAWTVRAVDGDGRWRAALVDAGADARTAAVLVRPDAHVAWVGSLGHRRRRGVRVRHGADGAGRGGWGRTRWVRGRDATLPRPRRVMGGGRRAAARVSGGVGFLLRVLISRCTKNEPFLPRGRHLFRHRRGRAGRHAGPGRTRRRGAARARDIRARHQGARPATPPSSPAPASRLHILPSSSRIGTSDAHAYSPLPRTQVSRVRIARLFATVEACGATFRSTCRVSTPSPVWDEAGVVPLSDDWEGRRARVVVWDRTLSSRPVWVG